MRVEAGSILGLGRSPGEGKWQPTPLFLLGQEFLGKNSMDRGA